MASPTQRLKQSNKGQDLTMKLTKSNEGEQSTPIVWGGAIGGFLLLLTSVIFVVGGVQLGLGSPFRLGTGAFPFITGLILAILSVVICIREIQDRNKLAQIPDWISLAAIIAALAAFATTADRLGLVPAAFLTVIVASLPDRNLSFTGKTILACIVAAGAWLLFIILLNLPLKPFASF